MLIANHQEWSTRSLESILRPAGYQVLRAYTGHDLLERARSAKPDVVLLDANLPDTDAWAVCRALRSSPSISGTPVMITAAGPNLREQRLGALRAGACEFLVQPLDAEEFLLRLDFWVRAKLDADRAREDGLVDTQTGLYNMRGLARRARELRAHALRHRAPLTCVVFGLELDRAATSGGAEANALVAAVERFAEALRVRARGSDAVGRISPTEFAIFAPETTAAIAVTLADRLAPIAEADGKEMEPMTARAVKLRAAYHVVPDLEEASMLDPMDLLVAATAALRKSKPAAR